MSHLLPCDITSKGRIKDDTWLVGTVVRSRPKKIANPTSGAKGKAGKSKGKENKGKGNAGHTSRSGYEIHLCGGIAPSDVILLECWDTTFICELEKAAELGKSIALTDLEIKEHTDKTAPWTTSRLPYFGTLDSKTKIKTVEPAPEWLNYHPVTDVPSLQHVPDGHLVCVVGRLLDPAPVVKTEVVRNEKTDITNLSIRCRDEVISMSAWREQAAAPTSLQVGSFYYFEAVKKISKKKSDRSNIELQYTSLTKQQPCPDKLLDIFDGCTAADATGARKWTAHTGSGASRDYSADETHWLSLSVCSALCEGDQRRKLTVLAQVPSIFISSVGESITYEACDKCTKAVYDGTKTCECTTTDTRIRWRGILQLTDDSCQITATAFEVLGTLAQAYADDEEEKKDPKYYHNEPERAEEMMAHSAAIPYTSIISFEDSEYRGKIEMNLRLAEPTFACENGVAVRHPLKPILRCARSTATCPPCAVAATSFDLGAGVALVPGGSSLSFRVLLQFTDKPGSAKRESESSPIVRVTRKAQCVLRKENDAVVYNLTQNGPIDVATKLLGPVKGEIIHAVVAWRGVETKIADEFKAFFAQEVSLHAGSLDETTCATLTMDKAFTPIRRQREVIGASSDINSPEPWNKRARKA
jgi:RNA polymerase subunit RPABC4/transcription elongation factor Spt4